MNIHLQTIVDSIDDIYEWDQLVGLMLAKIKKARKTKLSEEESDNIKEEFFHVAAAALRKRLNFPETKQTS